MENGFEVQTELVTLIPRCVDSRSEIALNDLPRISSKGASIMSGSTKLTVLLTAVSLLMNTLGFLQAREDPVLPSSLSKEQQSNLLSFLKSQATPTHYIPRDAKIGDVAPPERDQEIMATKERPIKQYMAQITPHRPVPGQEAVTKADVYFYRPNPEKGKPGITIKYTVDLSTGKQIGATEILTKAHTPISRDELAEAVAKAKEQSKAVQALYHKRDPRDVRYEYLQMKINKKTNTFEPGDRVIRFVFTANVDEKETPPKPVRVLVNLTKDTVIDDDR